jgi:hypothetical protein
MLLSILPARLIRALGFFLIERQEYVETINQQESPDVSCACFNVPYKNLTNSRELGMDKSFAEVSVLACPSCGQHWLRYFYEQEAFTASGRWYLGAITPEQLSALTADNAKSFLEGLDWYYYGGSYYDGRTGKISGGIILSP